MNEDIHNWNDISDLHHFEEYYSENVYIVFIPDPFDEMAHSVDIAFGIAKIPKGTARFFCVPYDDN